MNLRCLLLGYLISVQASAQRPPGTWDIELWLDSASNVAPPPTARHVTGTLRVDTLHTVSGTGSDGARWTRRFWPGRFAIDFRPFFGAQVAPDASTSVGGGFNRLSMSELEVEAANDTIAIEFIPGISHGGISAIGVVSGDSISGTWYVRAYASFASGRFTMSRRSSNPVPFVRPPPPPPPKPLERAERTEVRVRIFDLSTGQYYLGRHSLEEPRRNSSRCCYSTGTEEGGWGDYFWVPPGEYSVTFSRFDCANRFASLRSPVRKRFVAEPGDTVQITLEVHLDTVALNRTYDNTDSLPCRALRRLHPPDGV